MRIALTIHALHGGGAERLMASLANRWVLHHHIDLVTWTLQETDVYPVDGRVCRYGLGLTSASSNVIQGVFANLKRVRLLRAQLLRLKPDMVLSFSDQMNIVTLEAAKPLIARGVPVWIAEHSDPAKQVLGSLWEMWRRRVYPSCSGCIALTQAHADWLSKMISPNRMHVIPPAVGQPVDGVSDVGATDSSEKIVLFVGRLSREKRVDLLIAAWRRVQSQLDGWRLRIVGDGAERPRLEKLAQGVPRVDFLGWADNPAQHFQAASLVVLPSDYEGFPVVLLEAFTHGIPCLATLCTPAITELNRLSQASVERDCVATTPVGRAEELAAELVGLANSAVARESLSQAGRAIVPNFSWDVIGAKWDEILPASTRGLATSASR